MSLQCVVILNLEGYLSSSYLTPSKLQTSFITFFSVTMRSVQVFIQTVLLSLGIASAFSPGTLQHATQSARQNVILKNSNDDGTTEFSVLSSRREWIQSSSIQSLTFLVGMNLVAKPPSAMASGGATAGGVYLLSAKQRYNARVTAGIKSFLNLETPLSSGSLEETKAFFTSEEEGNWKDSSAAGYLLANAFRRNSTTPPDSLPSVKKWKAFAGELDVLQKSLKKKDVKGVNASYAKAVDLLDAYLEAVELPPSLEMRQT